MKFKPGDKIIVIDKDPYKTIRAKCKKGDKGVIKYFNNANPLNPWYRVVFEDGVEWDLYPKQIMLTKRYFSKLGKILYNEKY